MSSFIIKKAMNKQGYCVMVKERGFGTIKTHAENIREICNCIKHYFSTKHNKKQCPFCKGTKE